MHVCARREHLDRGASSASTPATAAPPPVPGSLVELVPGPVVEVATSVLLELVEPSVPPPVLVPAVSVAIVVVSVAVVGSGPVRYGPVTATMIVATSGAGPGAMHSARDSASVKDNSASGVHV